MIPILVINRTLILLKTTYLLGSCTERMTVRPSSSYMMYMDMIVWEFKEALEEDRLCPLPTTLSLFFLLEYRLNFCIYSINLDQHFLSTNTHVEVIPCEYSGHLTNIQSGLGST